MTTKEKRKIVIVDDTKDIRDIVSLALESAGYSTHVLEDGFSLITYLKNNQDIDAIILDLMMPQRDGISIFETIRSIAPGSKLIIYTAFSQYKNSVYGKEADAFIEKTEGVKKILEALRELL